MLIQLFSLHDFIQSISEGVISQDTNDKGTAQGIEGRGGPLDEMGEVEDEYRFDLLSRRCCGAVGATHYQAQEQALA
jgi:hypothetical protein